MFYSTLIHNITIVHGSSVKWCDCKYISCKYFRIYSGIQKSEITLRGWDSKCSLNLEIKYLKNVKQINVMMSVYKKYFRCCIVSRSLIIWTNLNSFVQMVLLPLKLTMLFRSSQIVPENMIIRFDKLHVIKAKRSQTQILRESEIHVHFQFSFFIQMLILTNENICIKIIIKISLQFH